MPERSTERGPAIMFQAITFQVALVFILQISSSLESCGEPRRIPNGFVRYESKEKGSSASYVCHPGYYLVGPPTRICSDIGWQGMIPECVRRSCGSPGDILNGWFTASSNVFGGSVTFYCATGYLMVGRAVRQCEVHGWSGTVPTCKAMKCDAPPAIERGSVSDQLAADFWEYGMVATYSCDSPYTLIGEKEIACSASGNWSHPPPTCTVIQCSSPEIPANSKVTSGFGFQFQYGQTIRYKCGLGFEMIGKGTIKCSKDNQFHPAPPSCNLTGCYPPHDIHHGWIDNKQSIYAQHATVKYRCQWGYKLIGSETIECTGKNKFDAPVPTCQLLYCHKPWIYNGRFRPGQQRHIYGDEVTFSCNVGYRMVGVNRSLCGDDGTFHPSPPRCETVYCHKPRIYNGRFTPDKPSYIYGDEVTFSCTAGYRMVGVDRSRCGDDGTFHPSPPRCETESHPKGILTIQDLMKVILPKAGGIMEEMKSIIKLEYQLLQKEENITANFREIFQHIEQFVNSTNITY